MAIKKNPNVTSSSNDTTPKNLLSLKQKEVTLSQVQDTNVFIPNTKLYPYNWFGITQGGGTVQGSSETKTIADLVKLYYTNSIIQDQLVYLAGQSGGNKTYVEISTTFALSYAKDDVNKRYVDAMLVSSENNYFWQQAQSFAQYINPKEYDIYIIREEDYANINKLHFWTNNEDILLNPIPSGQVIDSSIPVFVTDFSNKTSINPNGSFTYVLIGIKRVIPYLTGSDDSLKIWTEFTQNNPLNPLGQKISYIDIEYEGPFALNRIFLFDNKFQQQFVSYEVIQGKPLRQIDLFPDISLNKVKWTSSWINSLKDAWNHWYYVFGTSRINNFEITTSNEEISNFGFTGIVNIGPTYQGCMKNQDGEINGKITPIVPTYEFETLVPDVNSTQMFYTGNGIYRALNHNGSTGSFTGIDDGLNPFNSTGRIAVEIADFIGNAGASGLFSFGVPPLQTPEAFKLKSYDFNDDFKTIWGTIKGGDVSGGLTNIAAAAFALFFQQTFSNSNIWEYGIPRNYSNTKPFWKTRNLPYFIDITTRHMIATSGINKYNWLLFSKPEKNTKTFATIQGKNAWWYDSIHEQQSNNQLLTGFAKTNFNKDYKYVFPSFFSNYSFGDKTNKNTGVYSSTIDFSFMTLIPYELEEISNLFIANSEGINVISLSKKNFPQTSAYPQANYVIPGSNGMRKMENSIFLRPFTNIDGVTNNKQIIRIYPVRNNIINRKIKLNGLSALSIADYGGWVRTIKVYDENDSVIYTESNEAKNRTFELAAYTNRVFGSNLFEITDEAQEPLWDNITEAVVTQERAEFIASIDNPNNWNIQFNIPSTIPNIQSSDIQILPIINNSVYRIIFYNLDPATTYNAIYDKVTYSSPDNTITGTLTPYDTLFTTSAQGAIIDVVVINSNRNQSISSTATVSNPNNALITNFIATAQQLTGEDSGRLIQGAVSQVNETTYNITWTNSLVNGEEYSLNYYLYSTVNNQPSLSSFELKATIGDESGMGREIFFYIQNTVQGVGRTTVGQSVIRWDTTVGANPIVDTYGMYRNQNTNESYAQITQAAIDRLNELNQNDQVWVPQVRYRMQIKYNSAVLGQIWAGTGVNLGALGQPAIKVVYETTPDIYTGGGNKEWITDIMVGRISSFVLDQQVWSFIDITAPSGNGSINVPVNQVQFMELSFVRLA